MNKPTMSAWHPVARAVAFIMLIAIGTPQVTLAEQYWIYTVRPGDTIWALTERYTTDVLNWRRIQRLNDIPDGPDRRVKPGTRLRFPLSLLKHQPASAQVSQLYGAVNLIRATATAPIPATADTELHSGDRLVTGAASSVVIRFADGSQLLVSAHSDIVLDSLSAFGSTGMVDTRIRLQGGQIDTQVIPSQGPGSRYEIISPAAVAAVRGTDFRVSADSNAPVSRNEVLLGSVDVIGSGATQQVPAGYGTVAKAGEPPTPPTPLLPAPDLSPVNVLQQRLPLSFTWTVTQKAQGYRYQIAPDEQFRQLLADDTTAAPQAFWKDLPDGEYVLRVRAIDADRLEGFNARVRFRVAARPEPPLPMSLAEGRVVREAKPRFSWSQPEGITSYHLQLARDAHFKQLLSDQTQQGDPQFTPAAALQPGIYYWRLASVDEHSKQGPYSDVQRFEYKAVPASPEVEQPGLDKNTLALRWQSAGPGLRYHSQLATDPEFTNVLIERTTIEAGLTAPRPAPGSYYFRVQSLDDSGYAGPYGNIQKIQVPPTSYWPLLIPLVLLLL